MNTTPGRNLKNVSLDGLPIDRAVETRAREIFKNACAHVDARTGARLAIARREALDTAGQPSHRRVWLPAAGAIAACALALGVVWFHAGPASAPAVHIPAQGPTIAAATDTGLPSDADAEQLDLYQNLDFYQWLAQQPNARAPGTGTKQ